RVNTFTTGVQQNPALAMDKNGDFVVTWMSQGQDGSSFGVYAQRYDKTGAAQGGEFRVNTDTAGPQVLPSAAMDDQGNSIISFSSPDASNLGVFAQRYDKHGVAQGG